MSTPSTGYNGPVSAPRKALDKLTIVCGNPDIPFSQLHDDLLGIDERAGYCYSLNASAARIWDLISAPTSVGNLCSALEREFLVDPDTCFRDVSELLLTLRDADLVRIDDGAVD